MNSRLLHTSIDNMIKQNIGFAAYRIPGEESLHFITQSSGKIYCYQDIQQLNDRDGFVISPFRITAKCPIVFIEGEEDEYPLDTSFLSDKNILTEKKKYTLLEDDYKNRYAAFIHALKEGKLDKLVLSRNIKCQRSFGFSPGTTFLKACSRYVRSYVYICHTPQSGTWLGSTPEILLSGSNNDWHTVALAGTQSLIDGELPTKWDEKNMKEQRYVSEYIRQQLIAFGAKAEEEGPYTVRAGELAHLKSDFRFILPDNKHLGDLLKLLHPTPAVCGLPKEEAYQFILENEGYDRKYYSGFIGQLNRNNKSNIYVNLRCMNINEEYLTLYAGGGLLSSSTLEDEWQETEDKLYTMKAII